MPTPTIDELTVADEPSRWTALGFTLTDGCCQLGSVRVRLAIVPSSQVPRPMPLYLGSRASENKMAATAATSSVTRSTAPQAVR